MLFRSVTNDVLKTGVLLRYPVNAIACGVIDTDMNRCFNETERAELADEIPAGRFATADEAADMAYSVITAPDYLTGQIITFDGGWI